MPGACRTGESARPAANVRLTAVSIVVTTLPLPLTSPLENKALMFSSRLKLHLLLAAALLAVPVWSAFATPEQDNRSKEEAAAKADPNKWMEIKLKSSQEILAALARGDAKSIETYARRMLLLNVLEQWKTTKPYVDNSAYDAQLNAFEFATKELARTGKAGDINGALDSYVLLTKSCVKCHQVIRDGEAKK